MLGALKHFLRIMMAPVLYFGGIVAMLVTMFKDCRLGFLLLVILIPQPNVWYKFHEYPFGKDYMDFLYFAVVVGILVQRKWRNEGGNRFIVYAAIGVSYLSLWNSSLRYSLPVPITTANYLLFDWKNYVQMLFLYFLVICVVDEEKDVKRVMLVICLVVLFIAVRDYRNFSAGSSFMWDKRAAGPFWIVGLGANHMGAFFAHFGALLFGMALVRQTLRLRAALLAAVGFSLHPLFYAYSRGAYAAALVALAFYGVIKNRVLLVIAIGLVMFYQVLLPVSVVDRIHMTVREDGGLENSAGGRPELWQIAYRMFETSPIFGVGYSGYALGVGGIAVMSGQTLEEGQDVHSIYMRILCEQGVIGFSLFLLILVRAFISGAKLFRWGDTAFLRGLGLGFMGCVLAVAVTNAFGDRWSYFVLGGYFWVVWGLVDKGVCLVNRRGVEYEGGCSASGMAVGVGVKGC